MLRTAPENAAEFFLYPPTKWDGVSSGTLSGGKELFAKEPRSLNPPRLDLRGFHPSSL